MLTINTKIALRLLFQNRINSLLNIFGLTIGIACFILIQLFVYHEISFDKHHPNEDQLFRLAIRGDMSGFSFEAAVMGGPIGHTMREEIPEITNATRFYHMPRPVLLSVNENRFYQEHILFGDSCFFDIFHFEIVCGNAEEFLREPFTMVITENAAERFFGTADVVGKTINWNNQHDYTVMGVIKKPEARSHLNFDFIGSYSSLLKQPVYDNLLTTFFAFVTYNYITIDETADPSYVETKIASVLKKHMGEGMEDTGSSFDIFLQPVKDIHLRSHLTHELESNGSISQVYIFSGISLLILLVACINFINLTTARSLERAKEVGIKKTYGAGKINLVIQFLTESFLITIIALILAIFLAEVILPAFYRFSGIELPRNIFQIKYSILFLAGIVLVVSILAGMYPALYLTRFQPIRTLKGIVSAGIQRSSLRNGMVIFQLIISVFLVFNTFIIQRQHSFIQSRDLGVNKDNLIVVPLRNSSMIEKQDVLKNELGQIMDIRDVTFFSGYLGNFQQRRGFFIEDYGTNDMWMLHYIQVDHNYIEMMGIQLLSGRSFRADSKADSSAVIINKAMMEQTGWEDPIGKTIRIPVAGAEKSYQVIGVVNNFNYTSLHDQVESLLIFYDAQAIRYLGIRYAPSQQGEVVASTSKIWQKLFPNYPFDYFFQEIYHADLYKADIKMKGLFVFFTILSIVIATLGLLGLVIFTMNRRVKEIGIRKAIGASNSRIIWILLREYFWYGVIATCISLPFSWFFAHRWLQSFAYKATIPWWIFLLSMSIILIVTLMTVLYQTLRSARANPVEALRYE